MMWTKFSGSQRYWFFGFHQDGFARVSKDDRMVFRIGLGSFSDLDSVFFRNWIRFSFGFGFAFGLDLCRFFQGIRIQTL